ncbi:protein NONRESPONDING TO OXYLIPINS 2, mitochondrial [Nymphaea colorata]|nr:protein NONRESPONDING TO OXYLIPINS 2, mitochondrial [Nymphaea colorata]
MASRCRSLARPTLFSLKTAFRRPSSSSPIGSPSLLARPTQFSSRFPGELGCLQSLLPFHTAVATSRLRSCLGVDANGCRSMSKELGLSVPR